jgi:hypothetical protein
VLTPVFLILPPLAAVAVSLGDCHSVALSTSAHATRRLVDGTPVLPGKIALASNLQSLGHPGDTVYEPRRPVRHNRVH